MPERLHIVVLPAWYPSPEDPVAGIFIRDQARAAAIRDDVTVLAPSNSLAPPDSWEDGVRTLRLPPPRGVGRPARGYSQFHAISHAVSRLRKEGRPPDVVHAHVFAAGFFAVLAGRRWRLPVVVSEHHSDIVEGRLIGVDARVARFAYRHADLVCPVSPLLERSLLTLEPRARCQVVPNVVDIEAFAASRRPPAGREPKRHVLAVSSLRSYKGLCYLLDAVRLLAPERPGLTLTIIGEGPERARLQSLAAALPVTFLGNRSRAEIAARMSEADVFAMPSLVETFGIAAVEALAARLPVVVSTNCGVAELVAAHGGAVVPPADSGALRDALAMLLDRPNGLPPSTTDDLRSTYGRDAMSRRWGSIYDLLVRARR
jgi:glycosyltransferase involved in cell wall biosynthesis